MRTTLTIRDDIAEALKKHAFQSGNSFKNTVNEMLQAGLTTTQLPPQAKPHALETVRMGRTPARFDLRKTLQLADTIDDNEIIRKLQLRK